VTQNGQVLGGEEHLDAAGDAWLAADVAEAFQREDHLVHGRRAELEMAHAARKLKRAQILLASDAGVADETIAQSLGVGGSTVYRTKRHFVEGTLEEALHEEPRPGAKRKLTGQEEALLVATACSRPPEGRARWTIELLAGEMVRLTDDAKLDHVPVLAIAGQAEATVRGASYQQELNLDRVFADVAGFVQEASAPAQVRDLRGSSRGLRRLRDRPGG
jgi:transposase